MSFQIFDKYVPKPGSEAPTFDAWPIRISAAALAWEDHIPDRPCEAQAFVDRLYRLPVGAIAMDTEYRYDVPGVPLKGGGTWHDPTSLEPLILTGAAWVPSEGRMIRFLFDLRVPGMAAVVEHLLRMRTVFVAHHFKAEWHTLWALGLDPMLAQMHDTYVAARALLLGRGHKAITLRRQAQEDEDWEALPDADAQIASLLSLTGQCEAYALPHPYAETKTLLQASFLDHPKGAAYSTSQIDYALADAEMVLRLYLAQQTDVLTAGLHNQLHSVEFAYVEANARMEFDGVPVDPDRLGDLADGLTQAAEHHRYILREMGLENPGSPGQVIAFLSARGWQDRLKRRGKLTSKDEVLEKIETLDPAIRHIRRFRKFRGLLNGQLLSGELIGTDGRLHPNHRHLGAETGRNTCSAPNIVGLSRAFRPIVVAPPGRAILEADFSQIEVGIAAAEFGDAALTDAFNTGDVYSSVAREFYWDVLTEEERVLPLSDFKRWRSELRDRIKVLVLGVIYGMQDQSVADRFGISLTEAGRLRQEFLDRYPGIRAASERAVTDGRIRGYATILGGLRRHVASGSRAANQHVNTPVQASAGVVFRKAVADLYREFRGTPTRLVLPVHDSVVVECDEADVAGVRAALERIMISAVRTYYPELRPRVDVNAKDTRCWNKDGRSDSIKAFLACPEGLERMP